MRFFIDNQQQQLMNKYLASEAGRPSYLLLLVSLALLLHDDHQVLLALLLELRHLLLGLFQLHRHLLHLFARFVDLEQTVLQLRRRVAQLLLLLLEQSEKVTSHD